MATDNFILLPFFYGALWFYCPGKEAAMGIVVVSLPCTANQCGSFIALQVGGITS